jgi:ATP-dependent exoDNAse (exonuclease V) beta subunit
VLQLIEILDIWHVIEERNDGLQQRANLLKLIDLAKDFNQAQPESLEAMGIYGKNIETFRLWLLENGKDERADIHKQPHVELNADQSVVLSTWHASKGLEWPIVLVLDTHEEQKAKVPSVDMAYLSDDVDGMLQSSFVQLLMDFDDKTTKEKMLKALADSSRETLKNLCYVTLTRAREQVILPWFDNDKENTLISLLRPLLAQADFELQRKDMLTLNEPGDNSAQRLSKTLDLIKRPKPLLIKSVTAPSLLDAVPNAKSLKTLTYEVSLPLDLSAWDKALPANEVGNWVHRCYEIHSQNPDRIEEVFALLPQDCKDGKLLENLKNQLSDIHKWLKTNLNAINVSCEVSILALNTLGQTISGNIDMLVETDQGYWIIDHKTDQKADFQKHHTQLQNYADALNLKKPLLGVALNWVRAGKLEVLEF